MSKIIKSDLTEIADSTKKLAQEKSIDVGDIFVTSKVSNKVDIVKLQEALKKLQGKFSNNCCQANCCQTSTCQLPSCQGCQTCQKCQSPSCQDCQSCQVCQTCQRQCNCNCAPTSCGCSGSH